ncbi:MAG TPA: N-acetyltransferase [Flavobacteriales bacterium]|nr:N-acetyltransferase [Flavobacteriales bacterium]
MLLIRDAQEFDCRSYFQLVNDQLVRQNSIKTSVVKWEEHKKWFLEKLGSDNTFLFVAEMSGLFLGQVRFDYSSASCAWFIDYSIDKPFRGKGFAKEMMMKSMKCLSKSVQKPFKISALVRLENHSSRKVFQNLGFTVIYEDKVLVTYIKTID